jgi:hypothetical protein
VTQSRWHIEHPLARRASVAEKAAWHADHAQACGCFPTPRGVRKWIARHDPPATQHRFGDGERDLVDEASWESFPASDPPAY